MISATRRANPGRSAAFAADRPKSSSITITREAGPVWSHLKRSLANLAKRNLAQLTALIKTRLRRMQYRPSLLDGFLASTRLDLTPFGNHH